MQNNDFKRESTLGHCQSTWNALKLAVDSNPSKEPFKADIVSAIETFIKGIMDSKNSYATHLFKLAKKIGFVDNEAKIILKIARRYNAQKVKNPGEQAFRLYLTNLGQRKK